jgi:hypothetical protein
LSRINAIRFDGRSIYHGLTLRLERRQGSGRFLASITATSTENLGVDRANIGAGPAQRPDQLRNLNLQFGLRLSF